MKEAVVLGEVKSEIRKKDIFDRGVEIIFAAGAVCSIGAAVFERKNKTRAGLLALGGALFTGATLYFRDLDKYDKELLFIAEKLEEAELDPRMTSLSTT